MPTAKVTIKGLPELERALARLQTVSNDENRLRIARAGAETFAQEWKGRVPVLDGNYRDSIHVQDEATEDAEAIVGIDDIPGLPDNQQPRLYAPKLERSQASLRPAADTAGRQIAADMEKETAAVIEEVV